MFQDYVDAVTDAEKRVEKLTGQIADLLPSWTLAPVVEAVQADPPLFARRCPYRSIASSGCRASCAGRIPQARHAIVSHCD